jgi:hypothetical protein
VARSFVGAEESVSAERFFPGVDSLAIQAPATDYFETFTFRFSNGKVTAKYMEDSHAPTFLVSQAARGAMVKRP